MTALTAELAPLVTELTDVQEKLKQAEQRRAAGEKLPEGEVHGLHSKIKEVALRLQEAQKAVAEGRKPNVPPAGSFPKGAPQAPALPLGMMPNPAGGPLLMAGTPATSSSAQGSSLDGIDPDDLMSMFEQQDAHRQSNVMQEMQQRQMAEAQERQMAEMQLQLQQQQEAQRLQHQHMMEAQRRLQETELQRRLLEQQRIQREREIAAQISEARREAEIEAQYAEARREAEIAEQVQEARREAERQSSTQLAKLEEARREAAVQRNLKLIEASEKQKQNERAPSPKKEPPKEEKKEEEVLRCHLHAKKLNTKCKFCKRIIERDEAKRKAQEEKDKQDAEGNSNSSGVGKDGKRPDKGRFEVSNKTTFNINPLLREQIERSEYYKRLLAMDSINDLVDELAKTETVETHGAGTASGVVSTQPSTVFCCLLRFFMLEISHRELMRLVDSDESPFIRVCGLLYIRYGSAPQDLYNWLEEYLIDDQEFLAEPAINKYITIGEYVEGLLMDDRYYHTSLPRVPVAIKKQLEEKCAPLGQARRRNAANKRILESFRQPGTSVEVCTGGDWLKGEIVEMDDHIPTRTHVRVRLEDETTERVYLGKVILTEKARKKRKRSRSRSNSQSPTRGGRSGSPDWSIFRGKSDNELLEELRAKMKDKAVASGKDYARRPSGFNPSLAMKREMGAAASALYKEEMFVHKQLDYSIRGDGRIEEEVLDPKSKRKKQEEEETKMKQEKKLQELYAKYSATGSKISQASSGNSDLDKADVLRLG